VLLSGLPSPEGDSTSLLMMFVSLGLKVGKIQLLPDFTYIGTSAAVVSFSSADEAAQAIMALHQKMPADVGVTLKPPDKPSIAGGEGLKAWRAVFTRSFGIAYRGPDNKPCTAVSDHIFVSGLKQDVDEKMLEQMFRGLGLSVTWSKVYYDPSQWTCKALVQLSSLEDGFLAMTALSRKPGVA